MTIEPTASLWDCGEFIASCFKLEVGHPPGNPVFMVMGNFFTLFAGGNVAKVAANGQFHVSSGKCIYYSVSFLDYYPSGKKNSSERMRMIIIREGLLQLWQQEQLEHLHIHFSDSFWFSAVEGEVYASSSFFTALVFWAILKWEDVADEKYADRWIILIAFLMGLSIGVHLLNLLAIPAMVLVYYFRKFEFSWKGFLISLATSFILLALLMYGIMPGVVTISSKFDWFFVNTLGLPVKQRNDFSYYSAVCSPAYSCC